jgi:membrane protein
MSHRDDALAFALAVYETAAEHDVKYPAAAFAYYGFVALLPLLVLAVALLNRTALARTEGALPQLLAPQARRLIYESLAVASGRTGATIFAVGVFLWCGANMAAAFRSVVERVEGGRVDAASVGRVRVAAGVFASLCLAVLSAGFTEGILADWIADPVGALLGPLVLLVLLTASFLPLYVVSSGLVTAPRAALPGAFTAAFGWSSLVTIVQVYAANAGQYALYGVLSGIILIFTSLYVAAGVLLLGVVVNATAVDWQG